MRTPAAAHATPSVMVRWSPILALSSALFAGAAGAAEVTNPFEEPDESTLFRVEEELVTVASRYAQTADQAPSIVTVLTDREIRSRGYRTLADLLRSLPGVFVTVSQEGRHLAWFRGVISPDNNKFLLLVDGVPWYDGVYTHAWIDTYLPLTDVKQVEIIKGPGSAVHGTNAYAGVINVVTYGADDLQGGFFRAGVGDDGRFEVAAVAADRVGQGPGAVEVRATARMIDMDGDGIDVTPRGRRDVTGWNPQRSILGRFGLRWRGLDVSLAAVDHRHTYLVNEQDDPLSVLFQQEEAFWLAYRDRFARARYDFDLGAGNRITPQAFWQYHDDPGQYGFLGDPVTSVDPATGEASTALTGTLVETEKRSTRAGGSVEAELHPGPFHTSVGGVGVETTQVHALIDNEFVDFAEAPERPSAFRLRENDALILNLYAFAQHTWTAAWWLELTGGARVDRHNYFGTFASPRAGVLLLPESGTVIKLLYGRAFRAPTARELLVAVGQDGDGQNRFTAGNPDLRPESIDTVESEVTWSPVQTVSLRGAAFTSFIGDAINTQSGNDPRLGTDFYSNLGASTVAGGEAEVTLTPGRWDLAAAWSGTWATDTTTGFPQYGVPMTMINARVGLEPVTGLRLVVQADHVGVRPRSEWTPSSGRPDGDPYTLMHLSAATDAMAGGRLRADLSVRNLLDTRYEHLVYLDDADRTTTNDAGQAVARFPRDIAAEGRTITLGVEVRY